MNSSSWMLEEACGTKTCPRCGASVFEDMDVCYDCLFDFSKVANSTEEVWGSLDELYDSGQAAQAPLPVTQITAAATEVTPTTTQASTTGAQAPSDFSTKGRPAHAKELDDDIHLAPLAVRDSKRLRFSALGISFTCDIPVKGLVVGRDRTCDVVVCSKTLSRQHVRFFLSGKNIVAQDLGATNPALINGRELSESVVAKQDVVELRGAGITIQAL